MKKVEKKVNEILKDRFNDAQIRRITLLMEADRESFKKELTDSLSGYPSKSSYNFSDMYGIIGDHKHIYTRALDEGILDLASSDLALKDHEKSEIAELLDLAINERFRVALDLEKEGPASHGVKASRVSSVLENTVKHTGEYESILQQHGKSPTNSFTLTQVERAMSQVDRIARENKNGRELAKSKDPKIDLSEISKDHRERVGRFLEKEADLFRKSLIDEMAHYTFPVKAKDEFTFSFIANNESFYANGPVDFSDDRLAGEFSDLGEKKAEYLQSKLRMKQLEVLLEVKAEGQQVEKLKLESGKNVSIHDKTILHTAKGIEVTALDSILASQIPTLEQKEVLDSFGAPKIDEDRVKKIMGVLSSEDWLAASRSLGYPVKENAFPRSDRPKFFSSEDLEKLASPTLVPTKEVVNKEMRSKATSSTTGVKESLEESFDGGEIQEDVYESMKQAKGEEESFSTNVDVGSEITKSGDKISTIRFEEKGEEVSITGRVMGSKWLYRTEEDERPPEQIAYEQTKSAIEYHSERYLKNNGTKKMIRISQDVQGKLDLFVKSGAMDKFQFDPVAKKLISDLEKGFGNASELSYFNRYLKDEHLGGLVSSFKDMVEKDYASQSRLVDDASERDKVGQDERPEFYKRDDKFSQYAEAYGECWGAINDLSQQFSEPEFREGFEKAVAEFIVDSQIKVDEGRRVIALKPDSKKISAKDKNTIFEGTGLNQVSRLAIDFVDQDILDSAMDSNPVLSKRIKENIERMRDISLEKVAKSTLFIRDSQHSPRALIEDIGRKIDDHRRSLGSSISYAEFKTNAASIESSLSRMVVSEGPYVEVVSMYANYSSNLTKDPFAKVREENPELKNLFELEGKFPHSAKLFKRVLSEDISQKMTQEYRKERGLAR